MIEEYLKKDKIYDDYRQIEDWCKLQYTWYPVIIRGKRIPFMMNKYGNMVERESKKRVYPRENRSKKIKGKYKTYTYFRLEYKENDKLIKIDDNYFEVLKNTLPLSEEEIIINCNLKESYINMNNKISKDYNKKYKASEIIVMIENNELLNGDIIINKDNEEVYIEDIKKDDYSIGYLLEYTPFTIKVQEPVNFAEVILMDKNIKVKHELLENEYLKGCFKDFQSLNDIFYQLGRLYKGDQIRQIIKDGEWFVQED